jgi:hypothetical protein
VTTFEECLYAVLGRASLGLRARRDEVEALRVPLRLGLMTTFVGSQREIWVGSDGSGLIREARGPVAFFTEAGMARREGNHQRRRISGGKVPGARCLSPSLAAAMVDPPETALALLALDLKQALGG